MVIGILFLISGQVCVEFGTHFRVLSFARYNRHWSAWHKVWHSFVSFALVEGPLINHGIVGISNGNFVRAMFYNECFHLAKIFLCSTRIHFRYFRDISTTI